MANYYEMLKIMPTATPAEIETAIEDQYNQWRRLVTHYDPQIVNQANQSLQTLESIRAVLTDPAKRSIYDAGIGVNGSVGGLADPEAVLRGTIGLPPTPPTPSRMMTNQPAFEQVTDAWICPKCHTSNAIGTRFCKRCGQVLGRECPKCHSLLEATAVFCTECGTNVPEMLRTQEEAERNRVLQEEAARKRQADQQAMLQPIIRAVDSAWSWMKAGWLLLIVVWPVAIPVFAISMSKSRAIANFPAVTGDKPYREKAQGAFWRAALPMILLILIAVGVALMMISALKR